jgi:hypothetical protein
VSGVLEDGTGVGAEIDAGIDQKAYLCVLIRHIVVAGCLVAVARRH